jgi:hypothetical protein
MICERSFEAQEEDKRSQGSVQVKMVEVGYCCQICGACHMFLPLLIERKCRLAAMMLENEDVGQRPAVL